jgi:phosphoglycolate phosphatase
VAAMTSGRQGSSISVLLAGDAGPGAALEPQLRHERVTGAVWLLSRCARDSMGGRDGLAVFGNPGMAVDERSCAGRLPGMKPTVLLLWDVDHTLIENGGVSKENYALAFELLVGRRPEVQPRTDGRTDVAIMEDLLQFNGVDPAGVAARQQWEALEEAGRCNKPALAERGHAMKGAAETLARIAEDGEVVQSVLTGNIEPNAQVKLGTFGLTRWLDFSVGGFGTESRVRADLVPVAQRKAAERYGFDPGVGVTVLVGDTNLDVEAGLVGGARVIGVATGICSVDELAAAGAHEVLPDLADVEAFVAALGRACGLGPP